MEEKIDFLDKTPTSDTIQDFLYKLDMKPHMHIGSFLLHSMQIVQILVHSHFDLVSWLLALEATEPVPEPVLEPVPEPVPGT